jgi:DMSO/TMAO reductase YedYZ heme-binding membrane subunit
LTGPEISFTTYPRDLIMKTKNLQRDPLTRNYFAVSFILLILMVIITLPGSHLIAREAKELGL